MAKCECGTCRNCKQRDYQRKRRKDPAHRAYQQEYGRKYRRENADKIRKLNREYARQNPEWRQGCRLRNKGVVFPDGVTVAALVTAQNGKCAICARLLVSGKKRHVDHCHTTGQVRGVLCASCNMGIGQLADDPSRLRAAAAYLEYTTAEKLLAQVLGLG